jgi:hypothetical protein
MKDYCIPEGFYSQVFQTLYCEEIEKIKKLLEKRNFALVYVDEKDHPAEFFRFITGFLKAEVKRKLAGPDSLTELPVELRAEDASSAEFLSHPGLEIWWVSSMSPPRVHEVLHKLSKTRWVRPIVMMTNDELLLSKIKGKEKDLILPLQPLKNEKLAKFIEHYAVSINCEEVHCLESLKDVHIEANMTDIEESIQYLHEAIGICHRYKPCNPSSCAGISLGLAETLLIHFSQNRMSLLTSLRKKLLDFVHLLYEKKSSNSLGFKMGLKELLSFNISGANNNYPIDSLIMALRLRDLGLACLDFENEHCIFYPSKEAILRRINIRCFAEIMSRLKLQENPGDFLFTFGATQKDVTKFRTLIHRRLNGRTALNFGVMLWLRKELANIFPETCPTQIEAKNLLVSRLPNNANHYSTQWNRSLDFLQNLERLNLPRDLEISLASFYINKEELMPARQIVEHLFNGLLEKSVHRLRNLLSEGECSEAVVKIRDSLCNETCDGVLFAVDLGITLDKKILTSVVETLSKLISLINYRDPDYEWREIGSKILSTAISASTTDRFVNENIYFISETLRFEDSFVKNQKMVQSLIQVSESLKNDTKRGIQKSLGSFLKMVNLIFDLYETFTDFSYVSRRLSDAVMLESEFERIYQDILSWAAIEKRSGILNSLLVYDIICQAFGLFKSEYVPSELNEILSAEFSDVVLLVVDAMPFYFLNFFQKLKKFNFKMFIGFSVFPSETAPGHTSIFTGISPFRSHIFSNDLAFRKHSVSLLESSKPKTLPEYEEQALEKIYDRSITKRLKSVGVETVIFIPANYRTSLLTKIILGGSLNNAETYACRKGVDIFKESQMIPTGKAAKRFYIILDNEIDVTQHAGLKRYYYEEKESERLHQRYKEYFDRLTSFMLFITQNANKKGRKLLVIVTADHGVATLKYVGASFSDLIQECGLGFVGSRGRVVNCPEPTKIPWGIYSKYDLTLFENPQICQKIGLNRQRAQSSRLGVASIPTLYSISRVVFIRVNDPQKFDSMRVASVHCENCGYNGVVVITSYNFCPKCGKSDLKTVELGALKTIFLEKARKLGFHVVFTSPQSIANNSGIIWDPHMIVFPRFDSIASKYPSNPRECIMHLLTSEKKGLSRDYLKQRYAQFYEIDEFGEENENDFDKALQDLIDLHHVEERTDGSIVQITEDYSGTCTVITHGGISPTETIVPFIMMRNEVVSK